MRGTHTLAVGYGLDDEDGRVGDEPKLRLLPPVQVRRPNDRHFLHRIRPSTQIKRRNDLIAPWVDVADDVRAINLGGGRWEGRHLVEINERVYGVHENGTLFPVSGPGIVNINRGTYAALLIFGRYNGINDDAERQIARELGVTADDREEAIRLWRSHREGSEDATTDHDE